VGHGCVKRPNRIVAAAMVFRSVAFTAPTDLYLDEPLPERIYMGANLGDTDKKMEALSEDLRQISQVYNIIKEVIPLS
jgi:hypothetical protein